MQKQMAWVKSWWMAGVLGLVTALAVAACMAGGAPGMMGSAPKPTRTIIFVWDGLRPDSISASDTPNLYAMKQGGVYFEDNHAVYPTFTMMNGQAFATGSYPGTSGFYGNTFWTPHQSPADAIPSGPGAGGGAANFNSPIFTEDWSVLVTLDKFYSGELLLVGTLFKAAQANGLTTAAVGKSGAAFIQDLKRGGYFLDENTVYPLTLAKELQAAGFKLPANTVKGFPAGQVTLAADNKNPTSQIATAVTAAFPVAGGHVVFSDATDAKGAKATEDNEYMMTAYVDYILPQKKPDLTLIWFRDPDSTEHAYGPGSANYKKALQAQDARLGQLKAKLASLGLSGSTNLIVVSDHAHSNVSGPFSVFPRRAVAGGVVKGGSAADDSSGFSVSGDVRSADLLLQKGRSPHFSNVHDGVGCMLDGMSGIKADGSAVYPVQTDASGAVCGTAGLAYQTGSKATQVPATLATGSVGDKPIVIALNGGSDYFYVPSHDQQTVENLVKSLQKRQEFGAIFVDSRYGAIGGTFSMKTAYLENPARQDHGQPDVIVSYNFDEKAVINGVPGIEFESFSGAPYAHPVNPPNRGMHGSFSPIDVHNTLVVQGPSFKSGYTVTSPTGNVDVAPTVAYLLGTGMPQANGRVLTEALAGGPSSPSATSSMLTSSTATGLAFESLTDPTGATVDSSLSGGSYVIRLAVKDVTVGGKTYRYFDYAKAVRQ